MAQGKVVTQADLADIFGVTTATIRAWAKRGMPVLEAGGSGRPSKFNTADCIRWREAQASIDAADDGDDKVSEEEAKRRKTLAEAMLAELKLEVARGRLVRIDVVADEVEDAFANVRARMIAIAGNLALTLTNEPSPAAIRDRIYQEISKALNELAIDAEYIGRSDDASEEAEDGEAESAEATAEADLS
jgi:phage terminase Nu1 subunit (DNA packaging protein)